MKPMSIEKLSGRYDVKSWYATNTELPPSFAEPDGLAWAPTPLLPYSDHQRLVHASFEELYRHPYPTTTPELFCELVSTDYLSGTARRETTNTGHYTSWLPSYKKHSPETDELIAHAERPFEDSKQPLDFIRRETIAATELAKLTVPYGYRLEYVPEMRRAVDEAVLAAGGILIDQREYENIHLALGAVESDPQDINSRLRSPGMLATYKRHRGIVEADDGTPIIITERQAIGIRLDKESGLPDEYRAPILNGNITTRQEFMEKIKREFIQSDVNAEFVVPLSTTIFAHREKPDGTLGPTPATNRLGRIAIT